MTLFICQFCGRETTNPGANKKHELGCSKNPNSRKVGGNKKGYNPWNKGKSAKDDPRLKHTEETKNKLSVLSKNNNPMYSEIHRKTLSESMKKAHFEGRAGRLNPIEKYRTSNKPCRLYVVFAKHNGLNFIKIGITEQTVSKRLGKVFDEYEVLHDIHLENGYFIARFEKYLLDCFSDKRIKVGNFAGYTECFDVDIHNDIEKNVIKFLFTNTE